MAKLSSIATATAFTALALFAQPALAADGALDVGWNTKYGLLFSVENVFQNGSSGIVDDYGGGIGIQYNLSPQNALRLTVDVSRSSNPPYTTERVTAGGPVVKQDVIPSTTSSLSTRLGGSYLRRLSSSAVSPYLGAGVGVFLDNVRRDGTDDDTPGVTVVYDDTDRTWGVDVGAQLGLEWRVHNSVSLFAEYGLSVTAFSSTTSDHLTTTNGVPTSTEYSQSRFLNFDTGLTQGGEIGLVAYF